MGEPEPVDFFVSYTNADQPWAEWIAWVLEEAGISTLIQAWDFGAGANFVLEMDKAARVSQRTLAVLSPAFLESRYVRPEVAAAFREDPEGKDRKLLPVKVRECNPDGLLGSVGYVDLVSLEPGAARERLLTAARLVRAKPAQRPPFPGAAAPVSETMSRRVEFPSAAADARVDAAVSEVRSRLKAEHERRGSGGARRMVGLRLRSRDAVFFDREAARAELQRAIASPETGLVLVIGAPGVGKTALPGWRRPRDGGVAPRRRRRTPSHSR